MIGRLRAPWSWLSAAKQRRSPARQSEAASVRVAIDALILDGSAGERRVAWGAIQRIMAVSSVGYVGDTTLLIIELADGDTFVVHDAEAHQPALVAAIDALPGAVSSLVWRLHLMAEPEVPLEVYRRSNGDQQCESG